ARRGRRFAEQGEGQRQQGRGGPLGFRQAGEAAPDLLATVGVHESLRQRWGRRWPTPFCNGSRPSMAAQSGGSQSVAPGPRSARVLKSAPAPRGGGLTGERAWCVIGGVETIVTWSATGAYGDGHAAPRDRGGLRPEVRVGLRPAVVEAGPA